MRASFVDSFPLETFFFGGKSIGFFFFFLHNGSLPHNDVWF